MWKNWWQQWVTTEYRCAEATWLARRENETCGYAEEMLEWESNNPRPTFKQYLMDLAFKHEEMAA